MTVVKNVVIIGAGFGGLATAIALHKQGINVEIYDRGKSLDKTTNVAGIGLTANGLSSLESIDFDLLEKVKNTGCCYNKFTLKNISGETIRSTPKISSFSDKYDHSAITIGSYNLVETLASFLPSEKIHLDHNFSYFEQTEDSVEIFFENKNKVKANLLISADDIKSRVRNNLFTKIESKYLSSFGWEGVLKSNYNFIAPDELVFIKSMNQFMYILNLNNGYIAWITRKFSPKYQLSSSVTEAKSRVLEEINDWSDSIKAMVKATNSEQIIEKAIYDYLPLKNWTKGRVTLLGNAAHPMASALGQDANTAFEDAAVLAQCIFEASSLTKALFWYEKERIDRTKKIQQYSAEAEQAVYENSNSNQNKSMYKNEDFSDWLFGYKPILSNFLE